MQGVHMPDLEYSYFSRAMSAANLQEKITIWTAQRYIKISTLNCLCPPFQPTTDRILDSITTTERGCCSRWQPSLSNRNYHSGINVPNFLLGVSISDP